MKNPEKSGTIVTEKGVLTHEHLDKSRKISGLIMSSMALAYDRWLIAIGDRIEDKTEGIIAVIEQNEKLD